MAIVRASDLIERRGQGAPGAFCCSPGATSPPPFELISLFCFTIASQRSFVAVSMPSAGCRVARSRRVHPTRVGPKTAGAAAEHRCGERLLLACSLYQ